MEDAVHLEIKVCVTSVGKNHKKAEVFAQAKRERECMREK